MRNQLLCRRKCRGRTPSRGIWKKGPEVAERRQIVEQDRTLGSAVTRQTGRIAGTTGLSTVGWGGSRY